MSPSEGFEAMGSSTTAVSGQFKLYQESYTRIGICKSGPSPDGKEYRRTGKQWREHKKVAWRLVPKGSCLTTSIQMEQFLVALKAGLDALRLHNVATEIDGNSILIYTPTRCRIGEALIKKEKIRLHNKIDPVVAALIDAMKTNATSDQGATSTSCKDPYDPRARRQRRLHSHRRAPAKVDLDVLLQDLVPQTPVKSDTQPDIVDALTMRIITGSRHHRDLDHVELSANLLDGMKVLAAV